MSGPFVFAGVEFADSISIEDVKPLLACRGCLAASRPLQPLERALAALYGELVGTDVSPADILPKFVCSYCRALLLKFKAFRDKCLSSQTTFFNLHNNIGSDQNSVTIDQISDIIREDPYSNLIITKIHLISVKPDDYKSKANCLEVVIDVDLAGKIVKNDYPTEDSALDKLDHKVSKSNTKKLGLKHLHRKRVKSEAKKQQTEKINSLKYRRKEARELKLKNVDQTLKTETKNNTIFAQSSETGKRNEGGAKEMNKSSENHSTQSLQQNNAKLETTTNGLSDCEDCRLEDSDSDNDNIPLTLTKILINKQQCESPTESRKSVKDSKQITVKHDKNKKLQKGLRNNLNKKLIKTPHNFKKKRDQETVKMKTKDEKERDRKLRHETKSNVKIVILSKEEQIKQIESRKESPNYKRALHKCEFCYRGFNTEYSYNNHMTKHDLSVGDYWCDVCRMRYPSQLQLKKHSQAHHVYNFVCNQCGFISKSSADAGKHHRWHKGVKYDCKICGKTFDKPNSVMGHMHLSHGGTAQCSICKAMFLGDKGLRSHMLLTHKEAVGAICESCNVQFHSLGALQRHLAAGDHSHSSCAVCGDSFPNEQQLQKHQTEHHKKGYVCETCGSQFIDDGKYQSKAAFEDHCRTHSGEKPFKCHICMKTFATKQACRVHIGRHTAKKGIIVAYCRPCNKQFTQRSNYKRHIRVVHQNLRPFTCDICGTSYKDKYPLQTHINTKHLGLPWPKRTRKRRADDVEPPL